MNNYLCLKDTLYRFRYYSSLYSGRVFNHRIYQHLIHFNYGNLNVFQNEGQSEFAGLITGYDACTMHWLDEPEDVDGTVEPDTVPMGLYRWRRNSSDVLLDYQRAQLLHSYQITAGEWAESGKMMLVK